MIPPIKATVSIFDKSNKKPMIATMFFRPDPKKAVLKIGDAPPRKGEYDMLNGNFITYKKDLNLNISLIGGEYIAYHV